MRTGDNPLSPWQRVRVEGKAGEAALTVVEAGASLAASAAPCGIDGIVGYVTITSAETL